MNTPLWLGIGFGICVVLMLVFICATARRSTQYERQVKAYLGDEYAHCFDYDVLLEFMNAGAPAARAAFDMKLQNGYTPNDTL